MRIGASCSEYVEQDEGLPQGSVLSITCFTLAINDISKQLSPEIQSTLYVDDFAIFTSVVNVAHSNRIIQSSIDKLRVYADQRNEVLKLKNSGHQI